MANPFLNIFSGALGEANTQRTNTQQLQQALQSMILEAKLKQMYDPEAQFRQQIMGMINGGQGGQPQPNAQPISPALSLQNIPGAAMSLPSGGIGDVRGRPIDLGSALSRIQQQPQVQPQPGQITTGGGFRPTGFTYGGFTFENPQEKLRMEVERTKALKEARSPTSAEQWNEIRIQNEKRTNETKSRVVKDSALAALGTIGEIEKNMGSFGLWGGLPSIPGTQRKNWEVNINKLISESVLKVMNDMKQASRTGATGFGQLSNKELGLLQDAATALKRTLSPEDAARYLGQIKESMNKILREQPSGQSIGQEQQSEMKTLDRGTAIRLLNQAGGDKNKAREIANQMGYSF